MYIKFNREKSITKRKRKLIELHFEFEFLFYAFWPDYLVNFCVCVAPNDSFLCWKVFFSCSEELKKFFFLESWTLFFFFYFFFSFRSWAYWRCPLHYYYHLVVVVFVFSSLLLPLLHTLQHCVFLHTHTHARVHTHIRSHTRAYYIHMSRAEHSYVVRVCVRVYRCVLLVWEKRVFSVRFATICFFPSSRCVEKCRQMAYWMSNVLFGIELTRAPVCMCVCVSVWVWVFVHACMCVLFNQCLKNLVALFEQVILWFSIFSKWQRKMFVIFPHCNNEKCISLALQGIADTNPRVFREIWATLILSGRLI